MGNPYGQRQYQRNRQTVIIAAAGRCQVNLAGCTGRATTADHIIPVSQGGSNDLANLRACCRHCNLKMGAEITNRIRRTLRVGARSRIW